jgi:hemerythrin
MRLDWNDALTTGDLLIDDQHRRLFKFFNDLVDAMARGEGQEVVSRTLAALSAYVVGHFGMEENLMVECEYQDLASHRAEHGLMRIQVEDMVDQYNLIGLDPSQVMRVLKVWLIDHVQEQDRRMAQFILTTRPAKIS